LPYQTPDTKKGETYRNLFKKTQANKAPAIGKENRPVNAVPQKTSVNIYQRGLKRCLTATHESKGTPLSTATGAHTTKASTSNPTVQSLRGLLRGATSGRESTSRGNKTLFIGNQDPLKLDDKGRAVKLT
jgi:hypothetical protein